jgi:hypothetical protein
MNLESRDLKPRLLGASAGLVLKAALVRLMTLKGRVHSLTITASYESHTVHLGPHVGRHTVPQSRDPHEQPPATPMLRP